MSKKGSHSPRSSTVLFITNTLGYGGSEKHLIELLGRFAESGVRTVILCAKSDPFSGRLNGSVGTKVDIRREQGLKTFWNWLEVFRAIRPEVAVLVYGTLLDIPWFVAIAARLAGIRRLYAIQHLIPPPLSPAVIGWSIHSILRRLAGRRRRRLLSARVPTHFIHRTICVSDAVRDSLVRDYRFPFNKLKTIHNGVSLSRYVPSKSEKASLRFKLGLQPNDFVLVCVARLSEEKGIDILILAMSQLLQNNISCKCMIVGEGYLRDTLQAQIKVLNLSQNVSLEGFHEDVTPYLNASDAFVLTSHREGLPFAVLEAMACGLPCVVTDVGGNAEAVIQNGNGLVVDSGSVEEVVEAVTRLATHPELREEMSREARSRATREFDIETKMAEIKELILSGSDQSETQGLEQ